MSSLCSSLGSSLLRQYNCRSFIYTCRLKFLSQGECLQFSIWTGVRKCLQNPVRFLSADRSCFCCNKSPYGYSERTAGFLGATLLLVGLGTSIVAAPIFDRVLTHHLARTLQVMLPAVAATWLSLIWAGKLSCLAWCTVSHPLIWIAHRSQTSQCWRFVRHHGYRRRYQLDSPAHSPGTGR